MVKNVDYAIKYMTKRFKKSLGETVITLMTFTGRKLGLYFDIKNETNENMKKSNLPWKMSRR